MHELTANPNMLRRTLRFLTSRNGVVLCFFVSGFFGCTKDREARSSSDTRLIPYTVLKGFPHDSKAFTQGLTVFEGRLFESTGQANSWIAEVDIATGNQDKKVTLDKKYFGEGITVLNNKIYQLTWQNHVGFIYDVRTFTKLKEFSYPREGWGITHNERNLIASDGTDRLYFLDTLSLEPVDTLTVRDKMGTIDNLNELEFIDGYVYANRWGTNEIMKIDPSTGVVTGILELSSLSERAHQMFPRADVLNGIAYEKKSKTLLVTGKLWPVLFALHLKADSTLYSNKPLP